MGIRLYPSTKNPRNLEALCGVPEGTSELLTALEAKHNVAGATDFHDGQDRSDRLHTELFSSENEHLNTLHNFLLYGWSRFNMPDGMVIDDPYAGCFEDKATCLSILRHNGIPADVELCEGLHYC